jgi:sugar (pentulose or hexulose) kinase
MLRGELRNPCDHAGMQFIGIDLGSTSIKGAVLDLEARTLNHITRRPFPPPIPNTPRGHFEVDPIAVLQSSRDVLNALLDHAPAAQGILLCSQMHGIVLLDDSRRPVSNVITWQDQRALAGDSPSFDALMAQLTPDDLRRLGNDVWASRPLAVLHWLQQHHQVPAGAACCALPDFVFATLCNAPPVTDLGHAAASAMCDVTRGDWHRDLLRRLKLDHLTLPRIAPHEEVIGQYMRDGRAIPWHPPVADQQCALLGANLQAGELSINISTGSQVALLSEKLQHGEFQTRPYFDGKALLTLIHIPAGRSLNTLMRLLTELATAEGVKLQHTWDNVERLAQDAVSSDLQVDLSFFAGALGNEGAITRIREDNLTVGHLFRAAFVAMADNYARCALSLSPARAWQRIVFSGGLALQSSVLRGEILARVHGPSRLAEGGEDALVGLLAVALKSAGYAATTAEARALIGSPENTFTA